MGLQGKAAEFSPLEEEAKVAYILQKTQPQGIVYDTVIDGTEISELERGVHRGEEDVWSTRHKTCPES